MERETERQTEREGEREVLSGVTNITVGWDAYSCMKT